MRLVALPQTEEMLSPGTQCTVAGWGLTRLHRRAITLQEVQLTIQRDGECHSRFNFYTSQKQICVGDPREGKSTFLVRQCRVCPRQGALGTMGSGDRFHLCGCSLGSTPK